MPGEKKNLLSYALSAACEAIRDSETESAHPASPSRFRTCTKNARTERSRPRRGTAVNNGQRLQRFTFSVSDLFLGRAGQRKAVNVWT